MRFVQHSIWVDFHSYVHGQHCTEFKCTVPLYLYEHIRVIYSYTYTVRVIYIALLCLPILDYVTCTLKMLFRKAAFEKLAFEWLLSKGCFRKNSVQPLDSIVCIVFAICTVYRTYTRTPCTVHCTILCHTA